VDDAPVFDWAAEGDTEKGRGIVTGHPLLSGSRPRRRALLPGSSSRRRALHACG
jgi:hypothetical protein